MSSAARTNRAPEAPLRRRRRLGALLAAPALVVALALIGLEAWRVIRPRSPLFAPPFAYSLADAIATGNVQHAYQYVRAGQDPNQRIPVRHPELTRSQWVRVTPLEWAAAVGHADAARMLLGYGARVDESAICLAEARGHREVARVLRTYAGEVGSTECGPSQLYPFDR